MQKLSICVGQEQGVGGQWGIKGGYLEIFKTRSNTYMAVCRGWGCTYICTVKGRARGQGGISEHETKIHVRQGKGVGGLEGSQGGGD